jgi:hypothetical protein
VLDDGEPEARAAAFARAGLLDPVEALEDPREVRARDPDARVRDGEEDLRAVAPGGHLHLALVAVLDRVLDEVPERALDEVLVAEDERDVVGHVLRELETLPRDDLLEAREDAVDRIAQRDVRGRPRLHARVEAPEGQEVLDEGSRPGWSA